jgi:hypothetical protein
MWASTASSRRTVFACAMPGTVRRDRLDAAYLLERNVVVSGGRRRGMTCGDERSRVRKREEAIIVLLQVPVLRELVEMVPDGVDRDVESLRHKRVSHFRGRRWPIRLGSCFKHHLGCEFAGTSRFAPFAPRECERELLLLNFETGDLCTSALKVAPVPLAQPRQLVLGQPSYHVDEGPVTTRHRNTVAHTQTMVCGFVYAGGRPRSSVVERRSAKPKVESSNLSGAKSSLRVGPGCLPPLDSQIADRRVLYRSACGNELSAKARRLERSFRRAFAFLGSLLQRTATCHTVLLG